MKTKQVFTFERREFEEMVSNYLAKKHNNQNLKLSTRNISINVGKDDLNFLEVECSTNSATSE